MSKHVEDIDLGWNRISDDMKKAAKADVVIDVGITGNNAAEKHSDDGLTNADVGFFQEFGTIHIPERSAIRATIDEKHGDITKLFSRVAKGIIDGKVDAQKGLSLVGGQVVSWVKAKITKGIPPKLNQATIDRKGSDKPWIDFGQLISSITSVVRRADEGVK